MIDAQEKAKEDVRVATRYLNDVLRRAQKAGLQIEPKVLNDSQGHDKRVWIETAA
jgi:hypothetical protein